MNLPRDRRNASCFWKIQEQVRGGSRTVSKILQPHIGSVNGGARRRRALISQRQKAGLDGVSPHPVQGKPPFVFRMHWDRELPPHPTPGHPLPIGWGEGRGEGQFMESPTFKTAAVRNRVPLRVSNPCGTGGEQTVRQPRYFWPSCWGRPTPISVRCAWRHRPGE